MWASLSRARVLLRRRVTAGPPPPKLALGAAASRGLVSGGSRSDAGDDRKDAKANRRPPATERKHMYLVLQETKHGFTFRKLDMDDDDDGGGDLRSFPDPPVLRVEHQNMNRFAALGTNIIAMGDSSRRSGYDDDRSNGDTMTFDTRTAELAIMPDLPYGVRENLAQQAAVAVGNRLYVMEHGEPLTRGEGEDELCAGGLHCLKLDEDADRRHASERSSPNKEERWVWWDMYLPSGGEYGSRRWVWSDHPHTLPLYAYFLAGYALDPTGHGFFVSVSWDSLPDRRGRGTFSYDTDLDRWTRHGVWELPFVGQAHYDVGLSAWVGLHHDGHLCSCEVPCLGGGGAAPRCKVGEEKLFLEDTERHVDAKLVRMDDGRFLEGVVGEEWSIWDCGRKCVLRLTTFRVRYGGGGELLTTDRRPTRSYVVPTYWKYFDWQAFWM